MKQARFKAFISYSHFDQHWAAWLQHSLEGYRIPGRLVGTRGGFGPIPRRLTPVFRDREDLSSSADLGSSVKASLEASESLVVICSPHAANSDWVSEEVRYFQRLGREERVFALIVDGDPHADDPGQQCFPRALTVNPDGTAREPLAADVRKSADGRLLAKLKIVAGILDIPLDDLRQRDMQRRQRLWLLSTVGAMTIAVTMAILAVVAVAARNSAENRREHAEELVGYMVGDLKDKLDEVGRLDILQAVGGRVGEYLQTLDPDEVTDRSLIQQAKVWRQLGEVSMDQADLTGALKAFATSRDILEELHRRNPRSAQFVYELGNAEFWVGYVYLETGDFDQAEEELNDYLGWAYELNELEPGNPKWLIEKSYAHSNLAALINRRGSGDVDAALVHIQKAVEFNRQVIELAPDNSSYLSEFGGVMAWLADTQLLTCDLGGALKSRQENVRIARQLLEAAPANSNFRIRYAYSLTGLSTVAQQVGLTDMAMENLTEARDILNQLSLMDPSNFDLRFDYFARELYVAELMAESGQLDEAIVRMENLRKPFRDALESENYSNLWRFEIGIRFLLSRSEMAWRVDDTQAAGEDLDEALVQLQRLLESGHSGNTLLNLLGRARFLLWQQQGRDAFAQDAFAGIADPIDDTDRACSARANRVRQAILMGDERTALRLANELLSLGYFEPGFIRVCKEYRLCQKKD